MIGAIPGFLALAFLVTALLYASVGFGGGSTYSALLALSGLDYRLLPLVSLACNIVVVTGGSIRFARAGLTPWRKAAVIVAFGAPASFLGGLTPIREATFLTLLGASLVLTARRDTCRSPPRRSAISPAWWGSAGVYFWRRCCTSRAGTKRGGSLRQRACSSSSTRCSALPDKW
jgi:uncharacterized membrane protein YfcA